MQYNNTHTLQWCRPSSVTAGDYYYYFYCSFPHYARASGRSTHTRVRTRTRTRACARPPPEIGSVRVFRLLLIFFLFFPYYSMQHYYFRCFSARPSVRPSPTRPRRGGRPPTINARAVRALRADHLAVPVTVPVRRLAACGHIIIIIFLIINIVFEYDIRTAETRGKTQGANGSEFCDQWRDFGFFLKIGAKMLTGHFIELLQWIRTSRLSYRFYLPKCIQLHLTR